MTTTLRPILDRLIIELGLPADKAGMIVIPDKAKTAPNEGVVLAAGPGRYENGVLVPMSVKKGDRVLVQELRGVDFATDGKILRVMEEGGVLAVVERSTLTLQ